VNEQRTSWSTHTQTDRQTDQGCRSLAGRRHRHYGTSEPRHRDGQTRPAIDHRRHNESIQSRMSAAAPRAVLPESTVHLQQYLANSRDDWRLPGTYAVHTVASEFNCPTGRLLRPRLGLQTRKIFVQLRDSIDVSGAYLKKLKIHKHGERRSAHRGSGRCAQSEVQAQSHW